MNLTDPRDLTDAGGPPAPRSRVRGAFRLLGRLATLAAVAVVVAAVAGWLPRGTDAAALAARAVVGLGAGFLIIRTVGRMMRSLTDPPPPPPPPVDAAQTDVVYVCGICGTRVRLELAVTGKAPRHCGEAMDPAINPR